MKHLNAPLLVTPMLDTDSFQDVLDSVEQLQMWVEDDTDLSVLSIAELLKLQSQLQLKLDFID